MNERLSPKKTEKLASQTFDELGFTQINSQTWQKPFRQLPNSELLLTWGINRPGGGKSATMAGSIMIQLNASSLKNFLADSGASFWFLFGVRLRPVTFLYSTDFKIETSQYTSEDIPLGNRVSFHADITAPVRNFANVAEEKTRSLTAIRDTTFDPWLPGKKCQDIQVRNGLFLIASSGNREFYDQSAQVYKDLGEQGHWHREESAESFDEFLTLIDSVSDQAWADFRGDWNPPVE